MTALSTPWLSPDFMFAAAVPVSVVAEDVLERDELLVGVEVVLVANVVYCDMPETDNDCEELELELVVAAITC